eukprot:8070106-Karenia_brevis.AAC.1
MAWLVQERVWMGGIGARPRWSDWVLVARCTTDARSLRAMRARQARAARLCPRQRHQWRRVIEL